MSSYIDATIFIVFLLANLVVGLYYGSGVTRLSQYAVGNRNFSTGTLAATIIATWIGGGFFAFNLSKAYSDSLPFVVAVTGNAIALLGLSYFYSVRMAEFLGCNSVAEIMGKLYGKRARIITAICAICLCTGYIGLQIKVLSNLLNWSFGINTTYATIASTFVVIIYSAFGGIRSVTFTDVLQFLTFGTFIPAISMMLLHSLDYSVNPFEIIAHHPKFDINQIFTVSWAMMFIWFIVPSLDPTLVQRILLAKNVFQARHSFALAFIGCFVIIMLTSWIALLLYAINPNLDSENLFTFIMNEYSYTGIRGLTIAGVAAMVMSTVDSYINASSVIFAQDVFKPLGIKVGDNLKLARLFSIGIGIIGLLIALSNHSFFGLTLLITNFYMPIVTVPLTFAIFGFRTTSYSVLSGMAAGFITVVFWRTFMLHTGIESVIPGMLANLIAMFLTHYLHKQKGGWVGIEDKSPLVRLKAERRLAFANILGKIRNFNIREFFINNLPREEITYFYLGLFSIVSTYSTLYTLARNDSYYNHELVDIIYHSVLLISTIFLSYPIWPTTVKNKYFMALTWHVGIPYILVFISGLLVMMSNFGQLQSMIFMLNIVVVATLTRWQVALSMTLIGFYSSIKFYKWFTDVPILPEGLATMEYKTIYALLLSSSCLIMFLKPKQDYQQNSDKLIKHQENQIIDREEEMMKALEVKHEFLRNINHEVRAPMTGFLSTGQTLYEHYDILSENDRRLAAKTIAESSDRLLSLMNNILDFSQVSSLDFKLEVENINFSNLLYERIKHCQEINLKSIQKIEFVLNIEPDTYLNCNSYYMSQTIDNLIINAIKYSNLENIITINLKSIALKKSTKSTPTIVQFSIEDQGIGIPERDMNSLFEPFIVSSKTHTQAGGRGMGLALCKKIAEAHNGKIMVKANSPSGVIFTVQIPNS